MQTIYTLITQAYCGTVTVHTLVTSFLDRTLAEEALKTVESVNEHSAFRVHCHIKESKLIETRDEVELFNPVFFEQRKAEITKSGDEWRERRKIKPQIMSLEEQERSNNFSLKSQPLKSNEKTSKHYATPTTSLSQQTHPRAF